MAFNGSGVFLRVMNWTNDALSGIKIRADRHDQEDDNLANGLSQCITKDGQTTVTANLPMAGYKHTGVGNAAARTEYAALGQVQDGVDYYVTTGSSNAYVLSPNPSIAAYANQSFKIKPNFTNTGAATINVSGLGTKNLTKQGTNALVSGDLVLGVVYEIKYDGTQFQVLNSNVTTTLAGLTLTSPTISSATITSSTGDFTTLSASTSLSTPLIRDSFGNEVLGFVAAGSAVNYLQITNRATGLPPIISAVGDDPNTSIEFQIKGTGTYLFNATATSQAKITLREQTTNGGNDITLQTAAAVASSKVWTLPEGDVLNGVWVSNNAGVLTTGRMAFAEGFFDGTAGSPSFSVGSNFGAITDNGLGDYTLAFSNAASSTNYIVVGAVTTGVTGQENDVFGVHDASARLTTSVRVRVRDVVANAYADNNGIYVRVERVVS